MKTMRMFRGVLVMVGEEVVCEFFSVSKGGVEIKGVKVCGVAKFYKIKLKLAFCCEIYDKSKWRCCGFGFLFRDDEFADFIFFLQIKLKFLCKFCEFYCAGVLTYLKRGIYF